MSRQKDRAEARHQAKVNLSNWKSEWRAAARKTKGLTPLSSAQAAGYPTHKLRPVQPTGKSYPFSSARQDARYAARASA